ncbi:MAG: M23 family metallopeptidase [Actinomycetota bacterium]
MRVIAAALVLAIGSGAASAQEADAPPEAPRFVPLAELVSLIHLKEWVVAGHAPLVDGDRQALRDAHIARLDAFIGSMRAQADRTVLASLGRSGAEAVQSLPRGASVETVTAGLMAAQLDGVELWRAESIAPDWLAFADALARLRAAAAGLGPVRVCPVLGETWFTNNWGDDRPGGRSHKGIDLMGTRGTPVQAIEDGVVVQASWHRQGGRQIYIRADSTGDVLYYAHLESWEKWIWTGTRVDAGDVIGTLGSSGNADSPTLHFGWMPGSGRVDLDNLENPYGLLLEICPGNDVPEWVE